MDASLCFPSSAMPFGSLFPFFGILCFPSLFRPLLLGVLRKFSIYFILLLLLRPSGKNGKKTTRIVLCVMPDFSIFGVCGEQMFR